MTSRSTFHDEAGWVLLSDAVDHHLQPTDIVHHVSGCNMSNGFSKLRRGTPAELQGKRHCKNCEAKLARISRTPASNNR